MALDPAFDFIILGTGLTETLVGAALSRVGKKVCFLDHNDYYGSEIGTLDLREYAALDKDENTPPSDEILKESRRYNIDITPKLVFCNGNIINTMISSGIGKTMEFKPINGQYIFTEKSWQQVPLSKGDIFKSTFVTLQEKTFLMRFISQAPLLSSEDVSKFNTFVDLMNSFKLTERLQNIISYAISMNPTTWNLDATEGMERIKLFISSLGKYGETSFLFPLYGVSELPQLFARASSVFGGICVLRRGIKKILGEDKVIGVFTEMDEEVKCDAIVANPNALEGRSDPNNWINRCVIVTDALLFEKENAIAVVPPQSLDDLQVNSIFINQLNIHTQTCPKGKLLIHLSSFNLDQDVFKKCVEKLEIKGLYTQFSKMHHKIVEQKMEGLFIVKNVTMEYHMENAVKEAREIFEKLCPNEKFLEYVQDPNDNSPFDQTTRLLGLDETMK
jgi:RAB protein geranylgeranyltransferase component A